MENTEKALNDSGQALGGLIESLKNDPLLGGGSQKLGIMTFKKRSYDMITKDTKEPKKK